MCSGPRKPSPPPSPSVGPAPMAADDGPKKCPATAAEDAALLLELAASDDLAAFKKAVEVDGIPLDVAAPWYGRSSGGRGRRMGLEDRTPAMVAALYGSTAVLAYILSSAPSEARRRSPTDGSTALHLAAAGGAPSAGETVALLLSAAADVDALDSAGLRPADLIPRLPFPSSPVTRSLEIALKASPFQPSSPVSRVPSPEGKAVGEKREFPPDSTLPDIKNGIYGTDDFRMYSFKVKPCSRAYSHDWTECPFVHPGENARRRDPRKYAYSCVPCPEFRKGSCRNGDACEYAHGVFECWLHPAQYRTRLCKDETGCNRRVCFFAHKPEELRTVNPAIASVAGGMVLSSPRAGSPGLSSLDMAAALMMMQQPTGSPGSPMSPSASSGMGATAAWMNQVTPPSLQLPGSRLKASLSARDLDFDMELLGLEGYQQKLIDEITNSASPRMNWMPNTLAASASRASEFSDPYGSLDQSVLSQLQSLSLKQSAASAATAGAQFGSPTGLMGQNLGAQLLSGYGGNLPSSPKVSATSSFGLDNSMAKALMNSRASAFAKRSLSFCDRGAAAAAPGRHSALAATTTAAAASSVFSNWGSPDGKLDWGIQGEELSKLRKSASFGFRSNGSTMGGLSPASTVQGFDEPDLSWVQSLVKDGPAAPGSRLGLDQQKKGYQPNGNGSGGGDFHGSELFSPWSEREKILA